jgi:GNAT superfamily N-acetyltransferase
MAARTVKPIDFSIRPLRSEDRAQAYQLMRLLSDDLNEDFTLSEAVFARNIEYMISHPGEYSQFVVVTDPVASVDSTAIDTSDFVVGLLSMVCYRKYLHASGTALINELVVHSDYRNAGIGAALISRAFEEADARGMDEMEVGLLRENRSANRFYKRNGFDEEYILLGRELNQ